MFRFVIGLISGVAIGVTVANMSQSQGGQDLRAEFDRIRNDLQEGNFDAVGTHLEERFKELQVSLEERFAEVQKQAADVTDEPAEEADEAVEEVVGEESVVEEGEEAKEA